MIKISFFPILFFFFSGIIHFTLWMPLGSEGKNYNRFMLLEKSKYLWHIELTMASFKQW